MYTTTFVSFQSYDNLYNSLSYDNFILMFKEQKKLIDCCLVESKTFAQCIRSSICVAGLRNNKLDYRRFVGVSYRLIAETGFLIAGKLRKLKSAVNLELSVIYEWRI